jgi:hypothetical protein
MLLKYLPVILCACFSGIASGQVPNEGNIENAQPDQEIKLEGKPIKFQVHQGHFERNDTGLNSKYSFLVIRDNSGFEKIFGIAALGLGPTKKQNFVTAETFQDNVVVALIERGNSVPTFSKVSVVVQQDKVTVAFKYQPGQPSTARFASPLIISIPKGNYTSVEFVANQKKLGSAKISEAL